MNSDPYQNLRDINPEAIVFPEFDDACIGYVEVKCGNAIACYDFERCVEIPVQGGASYEEAIEHLTVNTTDAYLGEHTPAFLYR